MPIQKTLNKGKVPVKIFTNDIDSASMTQLSNIFAIAIYSSSYRRDARCPFGQGCNRWFGDTK